MHASGWIAKIQPANRAQKIRKPGAKIRKRAQFFFCSICCPDVYHSWCLGAATQYFSSRWFETLVHGICLKTTLETGLGFLRMQTTDSTKTHEDVGWSDSGPYHSRMNMIKFKNTPFLVGGQNGENKEAPGCTEVLHAYFIHRSCNIYVVKTWSLYRHDFSHRCAFHNPWRCG